MGVKRIWLDLEFTGIAIHDHEIREMAFLIGTAERYLKIGHMGENCLSKLFPGQITARKAMRAFLKALPKKLGEGGTCETGLLQWAGYNIKYDLKWIKAKMFPSYDPIWGWFDPTPLDVLTLVRGLKKSGKLNIKDCRLVTVAAYFGIPHTPHSALSDIRATRFVWRRIKDM